MRKIIGLTHPAYEDGEFDAVDSKRRRRIGNILEGEERFHVIIKHLDWLAKRVPSSVVMKRDLKDYPLFQASLPALHEKVQYFKSVKSGYHPYKYRKKQ